MSGSGTSEGDHIRRGGKAVATSTIDNPYRDYTWMQLHDCLLEKEYQLECMSDSVQRLTAVGAEDKRKDELVSNLRRELAAYKKNSRHKEFSYVSLEEHLASCESHLQEKSREAEAFHHELDEVKGQLHTIAQEKLSLQQQLSGKSTTLASRTAEVKGLQRQNRELEGEAATLRRAVQEKQTKISSLQDSVKRLRTSCKETQKRLEASESENKRSREREERARAELEQLKGQHHATIIAQLQARQGVLEQELNKTRRQESSLSSELSSLCEQVLRLTLYESSSAESTASSVTAVAAVSSLAEQCAQRREQVERLEGQLEEEQEQHAAVMSTLSEFTQCLEEFKGLCGDGDDGRVSPCLQSLITSLQRLHSNDSLTTNLKDMLLEGLGLVRSTLADLTAKWTQLTQQLKENCATIEECRDKEEPLQQLSCLVSSQQSSLALNHELQERLSTKEVEHSAALSAALSALRQENQLRINEAVERAQYEENECHQRKLQEVRVGMEGEREMAVSEEKRNTEAAREELQRTKQLLAGKENELEQKPVLEARIAELQGMLGSLEQSKTESLCVAEEQTVTLREHLQSEVDSYKEQSQQYALTIAAMEEKMLALMQKQQSLQSENESLTPQETKTEDSEQSKLEKLEQLTKILRHQLAVCNRESEQHQSKIQELRKEIEKTHHTEDQLKALHTNELEDMRKTLSSQENMVESQRQELCRLRGEVEEKCAELTSLREEHRRREDEMTSSWRQQMETVQRESKESGGQLFAVGLRCLGERHTQVLARQRETLLHIRQDLKDAKDGNPTEASHEATLGELDRVREELVEERAKRHLEAAGEGGSDVESASESDPVIDALQCSEDAYFHLMGSVCEGGFMRRLAEKKMPLSRPDDRHSLVEERRKFAEKVARKIRTAARLAEQNRDMESFSDDESSECDLGELVTRLKTQLEATTEELEQQKRLNLALVRRKEFREQQLAKVNRISRPKTAAV